MEDGLAAEIAAFRRSLSSASTVPSATSEQSLDTDKDQKENDNILQWEDVYRGQITQHHLDVMKQELGLIEMCWDNYHGYRENSSQYPDRYLENTQKENLLLCFVSTFRLKFNSKFPARRPLLMACNNECGIQKMVCTTLRPTSLRYAELQSCTGCASFVSDYVQYVPLINATGLPDQLVSPGEVLARQTGHCYEMATLLASLLIGASYNAFVVSGYATKEICVNDLTRIACPYLYTQDSDPQEEKTKVVSKYELDPPRDLRSKFLLGQEAKEKAGEAAANYAQAQAEQQALQEFERPPPDPISKYRRHAWVLVLPSKDINETCFFEPASGVRKPLNDAQYHGIDSLWNNMNYWVAVGQSQINSHEVKHSLNEKELRNDPLQETIFNLSDANCWQPLLQGESSTALDNESGGDAGAQKHLDMPSSWVSRIDLPHSDYERRYVDCHKKLMYRKAVVELIAPYSDNTGMLRRVTRYSDYECTQSLTVMEEYKNRADFLCYSYAETDKVLQKFKGGRPDALKEHKFTKTHQGFLPTELEMEFYFKARHDDLYKLNKDSQIMIEEFKNRQDYLHFRRTSFDLNGGSKIKSITETFERNKEIPFSMDAASITYYIPENKVAIVYHYGDENITAGSRELCLATMKQTAEYQPYAQGKPLRPLQLHHLLQNIVQNKQQAESHVKMRQEEIEGILLTRARELVEIELSISQFDQDRNQDAREQYKQRDRKLQEETERNLSLSVDALEPYLVGITQSSGALPLHRDDAIRVYTKCLDDWKNTLLARATHLQRQFEKVCNEEDSESRGKELLLSLHCLQLRLTRHKELAPQRYIAMDHCLRADPRLQNAFTSHSTQISANPFMK